MRLGTVSELPGLLGTDDLVVLNNSRVLPAKIFLRDSGGRVYAFLILNPIDPDPGKKALSQNAGRLRDGEPLIGQEGFRALFRGRDGEGRSLLEGIPPGGWVSYLRSHGAMPLPPYIRRKGDAGSLREMDRVRYQTSYAEPDGSVAAPTAGLHFTPELLAAVGESAGTAFLTLHVGEATFRSHEGVPPGTEAYRVPGQTWNRVRAAKRVVAVGTTVCRTLEHLALGEPVLDGREIHGTTGIIISPGFDFKITGALMTNFHMPESSPLALAAAFVGKDLLLRAYAEALRAGFRFASYGDSMIIL